MTYSRSRMTVCIRHQLSSAAKFVAVLSLLTTRPIRIDADTGISPHTPEKCRAGGSLAIDDQTLTPPYYGNGVSDRRALVVLIQETYVLSDMPLPEGILKRFFVYFQKPPAEEETATELPPNAKAMLQIWRPEHSISTPLNKVYTLVYSIPVGPIPCIGPDGSMATYAVDKFVTMSGDVMGFTVDHEAPLPISCGRNRTRSVLILASPKHVLLSEEYDFPQQSVQRFSCAMAVEVVPLNGCTLCSNKQKLQAFAKKSRPQDLPEEEEESHLSENESSGVCMEGSITCNALAGIIGGVLGIAVIALVILAIVQYHRLSEEMKKPSNVSPTARRKT